MKSQKNHRNKTKKRNTSRKTSIPRPVRNHLSGAPIAQSGTLQQKVEFRAGNKPGNLIVRARLPLISVCGATESSYPTGGIRSPSSNTALNFLLLSPRDLVNVGALGDYHLPWINPVLPLMSSAFTRYRINKLVFEYMPQVEATRRGRLVFAYADDPVHPLLYSNSTDDHESRCLAVSDSIAFAAWTNWTLDVSKNVRNNILYVADPYSAIGTEQTNRFSHFGIINIYTSPEAGVATTPEEFGILYVDIEVELMEFCPIARTVSSTAVDSTEKTVNIDGKDVEKKTETCRHGKKGCSLCTGC